MSKTKKNLIIIGSIVGALILLMVLFGTLFSLRTIKVDYATSTFRVEEYTKSEIIEKSSIKKGKNIVFANYEKAEAKLEKAFPYASFNIVKTFPNTAIIYVYERAPVFRILSNEGFWYIFDEDLKCLEIVAPININENGNSEVPILSVENLTLDVEVGGFWDNKELKNKMKEIIDGVYGFEATPLSIMSHIALSNDDILGTNVITLKVKADGVTIVIQGDNLIKEKIAHAVYIYASDVSQNVKYQDKLDRVTITVYKDFTLSYKHIFVKDGSDNQE